MLTSIKTYSLNSHGQEEYTGKQWRYIYQESSSNFNRLSSVVLPDGTSWHYEGFAIDESPSFRVPENQCVVDKKDNDDIEAVMEKEYTIKVTHPNGVQAHFVQKYQIGGISNQPSYANPIKAETMKRSPSKKLHFHPRCYLAKRLQYKTIINSASNLTWQYQYDEGLGGYASTNSQEDPAATAMQANPVTNYVDAVNYRRVTVINPDLSKSVSYVNRDYQSILQGKTVYSEQYSANGEKLSTSYHEFKQFPLRFGTDFTKRGNPLDLHRVDRVKTTLKQLTNSNDSYYTEYSGYDVFGNPSLVKEHNNFSSNQLYTKRAYLYDLHNWLIGLPLNRQLSSDGSNWSTISETNYYPATGAYKSQPYQTKVMGKLLKTVNSYHANGNVKRVDYNGVGRYELFEDYYRGQARKVTLPCSTNNGCNTANGSTANTIVARFEINPDGRTQSVTDFAGNQTRYSYNPVGWVTKIEHADSRWTDKNISYSIVTSDGDGISGSPVLAGQLKQMLTQGEYQSTTYYDLMHRKILTQEKDSTNSDTHRYQYFDYDFDSKLLLQTFVNHSAGNRKGVQTTYDALGRVISTTRQSDNATTSTKYLSGNRKQITDAKGNITTITYLAYGSPSYDKATLIQAPDAHDTSISYNKFGQVTSITQGGVNEKRLYDSYQQLCKTYRPETGMTAFGYNTQRQLIWQASGTSGSKNSCDSSSVPASDKIILSYDNLGQLKSENYPDNTPDKHYSYDANGNITNLISGSGSDTISWQYQYNSLNLVEKETLAIDGKSFILDWEYNNLGAVSSLKYPSGRRLNYSPNALGQPTKISEGSGSAVVNYASNVEYYPNGQLKNLSYGNGVVRSIGLDTSGRIDTIKDVHNGSNKLYLSPRYDKNDNLVSIVDWVDRGNDIGNMTYDGVDRLRTADGKWGQGTYTYDGLGNLKSRTINGSSITYHYNSLNRLNNLSGSYAYNYSYDTRGNVTHNGRYGLTFNRANQLITAKGIPYRYDGHNRRVKKQNDYSVYSNIGQLLYRQKLSGQKTDSLYLGKHLIAEVDFEGEYVPPVTSDPFLNLSFYVTPPDNMCPTGQLCPVDIEEPKDNYFKLVWSSINATSCSGYVKRNNVLFMSLSGLSHLGLNISNDGAAYYGLITCTGRTEQVTKSVTFGGNGAAL
ncbi:hypothetical protein L1D44_19865 [Shewanella sp. Isolate13]|uniref:RHS repeat domain-containing protein n=1 Tax=Shewanella sp. Isolate13 TaxID=2908531 RepID=UPI001EFE27C9|nr:hypothetical protein [Shewanella sp. Isolate13]MCG9732048.1 hypothetical protein [Shewanella sp. Isolate13]